MTRRIGMIQKNNLSRQGSSVGESGGFITLRSGVRISPLTQKTPARVF